MHIMTDMTGQYNRVIMARHYENTLLMKEAGRSTWKTVKNEKNAGSHEGLSRDVPYRFQGNIPGVVT